MRHDSSSSAEAPRASVPNGRRRTPDKIYAARSRCLRPPSLNSSSRSLRDVRKRTLEPVRLALQALHEPLQRFAFVRGAPGEKSWAERAFQISFIGGVPSARACFASTLSNVANCCASLLLARCRASARSSPAASCASRSDLGRMICPFDESLVVSMHPLRLGKTEVRHNMLR